MQGEDVEQLFHELEQRHVSLRSEHDAVCHERNVLKLKVENLEKSLTESRATIDKQTKDVVVKDSEIKQVNISFMHANTDVEFVMKVLQNHEKY